VSERRASPVNWPGKIGAMHLRIDSIELAMWACGVENPPLDDAGYRVAYAIAADNLRIGNTVIADSVNPVSLTRAAWRSVADSVSVPALEIEVICSDTDEHRRRVETRVTDIPGFTPPTWEEVRCREYEPWGGDHLVIDTARGTVDQNVSTIRNLISDP
jgi:predicted kinase